MFKLFQGVMWLFLLTVSLLCWGSDGIACKNENGVEVDWYILYKEPKGLKYISIESTTKTVKEMDKDINDYKGFLAQTLQPLFQNPMPDNIGFISCNDQPIIKKKNQYIKKTVPDRFGHSKGVVMVDKTADSGFWLLHSKPGFPAEKYQNKFWYRGRGNPQNHKKYEKAQTFICVTFKYEAFRMIGEHLQEIRAFPFDSHCGKKRDRERQRERGPRALGSVLPLLFLGWGSYSWGWNVHSGLVESLATTTTTRHTLP
ncbi:hypothetical protein ACEWY4_019824 [Coilia grayii]|uniref:Deoxyribonuclease-2-alpha n=1 Tax=Coilia grayii TaxID=363190 RepID=A0ABD1JE15_9TELE